VRERERERERERDLCEVSRLRWRSWRLVKALTLREREREREREQDVGSMYEAVGCLDLAV
jgi:hypothetical protein